MRQFLCINVFDISVTLAGPLFWGVANSQAIAVERNQNTFETFADWCDNRAQLAPAARHTVNVLLQQSGTQECDRAEALLSNPKQLPFTHTQIVDVAPLDSLTHLTSLDLTGIDWQM